MNVHHGSDAVGSWAFRLHTTTEPPDEESWKTALQALSAVAKVLNELEILVPGSATMEHWREAGERDSTKVSFDSHTELFAHLESPLGRPRGWGLVELTGQTRIDAPDGARAFDAACVLGLTVGSFGCWIRLSTYSDVWMPYNVMAQSQAIVAALNAPRLRAALEAIEQIVGSPGTAEDSPFAKVAGYELRNHIVRGDVLDIQDMGYDESWIAERWPDPDPSFDDFDLPGPSTTPE